MTCFHPLKLYKDYYGEGKNLVVGTDTKVYAKDLKQHGMLVEDDRFTYIPCGKCKGCLVDRSKEWANRLMLELEYHEKASFLTLTYNDDNVPMSEYVDEETGELKPAMTLRKKDFQNFMKRLRKQIAPVTVRFFACGEYGDKTKRPHYHVILFGYDFPDKDVFKVRKGFVDYRSALLEKVWTNPKTHQPYGYCLVNEVNWNTCAYVSRYCLKKYGQFHNIYYQSLNIEPEFNLMSRRPGIGRKYYDEHKDEVYIKSQVPMRKQNGLEYVPPPKYFDRLYAVDNPEHMEQVKLERKERADERISNLLRFTDKSYSQLLKDEEYVFLQRIRKLRRGYQ